MTRGGIGGRKVRCDDGSTRIMIDSTGSLRVKVEQEDTVGAICGDPANCAIARAVVRVLPGVTWAAVGADKAYVIRGDKVYRYQVPPNEAALIRTFDSTALFPIGFTATLRPPSPRERLGARAKERGFKDRSKPAAPPKQSPPRMPTRRVAGPRYLPHGRADGATP